MNENKVFTLRNLGGILFVFYVFINFFPTIRLLLVGGQASQTIYEYSITVLPDVFLLIASMFSVMVFFKGHRFKLMKFDWLILFFILFNTVYGTILSQDIFISAEGFRLTYLSVFFYFVGRLFSTEEGYGALKKMLLYVFVFYVVFAILGFILHFGFPDFEKRLIETGEHEPSAYFMVRMGSFVLMPVLFGTLMSFACIYFFYRLVNNEGKWNYVFIAILWAGMFLSVSRGPIIAFLLAFSLLTILSRKWMAALYVFLMIAGISFALSWILVGSLTPVGWLFNSTLDTLGMAQHNTRVSRWQESLYDFRQRPAGYGLGHSGATAVRFLKGVNLPAAVYTTDGWYLKLACESGIYGFLLYVITFGFYFYKGVRYSFKSGLTFFAFPFALFIMVNAQNVVENVLDYYPCITLYWLVMGATQHMIMGKRLQERL